MASKIGYIRKEIPEFTIPPYRGESYETVVPDTLDLAERAELAINGLTGVTDPETDHEIYFAFSFRDNCAILQRDFNDWIQPKFLEDLPLLRIITGSDFNHHVDRAWMEVFLHMIGPDGLAYMPVEGRPWGTPFHAPAGTVVWRTNGSTTSPADESVTQRGHPAMWNGRMLGAATIYYLRDNNPLWRQTIERIIQRLSKLVIDKGNYSYLPAGFFEPNAQVSPDAEAPKGTQGAESGASIWLIQALAQYYKVTGYESARELAGKLITYLKSHSDFFDVEGRYVNLGAAQPKDTFTITFPIVSEQSAGQINGGIPYTVVIRKENQYFAKGNNMINVDAPGEAIPLYQRAHYRSGQAPTKQVTRFVSEEDIHW